MSKLFSRTLREDPSDAENRGHRLLVRAGYVRRAGSGAFTFLPLGWAVYRNVERIVREEMERAGFQEVHFPALLPREPFERSGRWQDYGDSLFRLKDRRGSDHLLAPTHEEFFTMLVKDICSSWKDLPTSIFQIQTKFRDEARPRGGLLRGREFVMKDSYSFDLDDAGLAVSYQRHRDAYQRTFDRLGLDYVIVSAMSGAMGGSVSEEFLCPMEVGEDTFVRCPSCGYAANTEAVQTPVPGAVASDGRPAAHVEDTPRTPTIDTLVDHLNDTEGLRRTDRPWAAGDLLKNVVFRVRHPDATTELVAVGLPGDRAVDPKRLEAQLSPSVVEGVPDEVLAATPGVVLGYIGPGALGASSPSGIRYLLDPRIVPGTAWVTGANEPGRHVLDLVAGRDFEADGVVDAAEVRAGDACPSCGTGLAIERGIEIGHIFQLGRTYAEAFGLVVQGPDKEPATVTMGSYGIGVTRLVGALAETTADDKGLCWPVGVGPADVHVVVAAKGDEHIAAAERLAESAEAAGLRVLLDDRAVSPGVKFADAELLGVPWIVVVGRALARGEVEVRDRRSATAEEVPIAGALAPIAEQRVAVG